MALDPTNFLRVLSDAYTPVRDLQGRLLGAVPRVADTAEIVGSPRGEMFELRIASQVCVCVDLTKQTPKSLDGFIPLDPSNADLAEPVAGTDADIGVPI